jgi:hypothetical protein
MTEESDSSTLIGMIPLRTPGLPDLDRLLAVLQQRCTDTLPDKDEITQDQGTYVFRMADDMVAISLMPAPIPWSDLEGSCAAAWWWPEATEQLRDHTAHLIVALLQGRSQPVQRHLRLTTLLAALTELCDAAGVYYCLGTVVHEPNIFREQAAQLSPDNLLPNLWVDMRLGPNEDGSVRYFTTGMESLGHREIEIDGSRRSPEEVYQFCYSIIDYLLTNDVHLKDGETVGRSAQEKIGVRHGPSMWEGRGQVLKLVFR